MKLDIGTRKSLLQVHGNCDFGYWQGYAEFLAVLVRSSRDSDMTNEFSFVQNSECENTLSTTWNWSG